jgi:pimeloyl-ACP methyl ester carboxylesterase
MTTLDRHGIAIHYNVSGSGAGAPLLLTHGFSATAAMFSSTVASLSTTRRCIVWDVRGHGRTDYPTDPSAYTVELVTGDMMAILDASEIDRAVLLGHSMGGYLSLEMQRRHPDRVSALVLVGTGPGYRNVESRARWNALCERYAVDLETKGFDGLPGDADEVRADAHRGVSGLILAARGILAQRDAGVINALPEVDVPTLIVVGERDTPFRSGSTYMADKIPGARLVVIPGAGHAPMLTHPDQFIPTITEFLAQIDGG